MADEQSEFNVKIQNQQDMMQKPTQMQINTMRQENKMIHKELERTQVANREMLTEIHSLRGVATAMSPTPRLSMKLNERLGNLTSSLNDRKTSASVYNTPLSKYNFAKTTSKTKRPTIIRLDTQHLHSRANN